METQEKSLKENLVKIWRSRSFQIFIDVCRILMLIVAILILVKLVSNIEEVKILGTDACRLCENRTGALCFIGNIREYNYTYPKIDYSLIEKIIINNSPPLV